MCFLLTEIPVSDAQMYLKTSMTIKTGTVRTENNNHTNDRAIVCVVLFLVVGWLHMTTDGLVVDVRRVVSSRRPGGSGSGSSLKMLGKVPFCQVENPK